MAPLQAKEEIKKVYPYKKWWARVDKMSEAQIIATFLRFKSEGKL
jgi:hypothetical protein